MSRTFDHLRFTDTMERHPEGVAHILSDDSIKDSNKTFRHITGMNSDSHQPFSSLLHPSQADKWASSVRKFLVNPSGTHRIALRLKTAGPSHRWVRLSFLPLEEEGFLIFLIDITDQKRLETKLIRARDEAEKATKTKSEFLANTSHEIRTPIHTIIGMSELLEETSLDEEQAEYLGQIRFATNVLLTLINDILDFSKIEAGQLQLERTKFDLISMLEGAVDLVTLEAHKKNVDFGLYIDPQAPSQIYGDPTRLRQVIVNLANNAVKFTHRGQVILDVETQELTPEKARIKFSVIDSGIGIPPEKQKNLFQSFHQADSSTTRRYGGTGLGLFISRNIVFEMGGVMSFSSKPGSGSTFFFELEVERADGGVRTVRIPDNFFPRWRILLIDDNDTIRDRLARTLGSWGLRVQSAGEADEALGFLRSSQTANFDLIIVDQTMPHIDGWQFASQVHTDFPDHRPSMVLMSMKGGRGTVEARMKILGWFDAYLTKPVRQSELMAVVFRLLQQDLDVEEAIELEEVADADPEGHFLPVTGKRVLIVEDHEVNRQLLMTILKKNGHTVSEASNGKVACNFVREENPEMVFMDCQMPVMNGYEATRIIRESGYEAPIIAVTASALPEERIKCLQCGMTDLVIKPFGQAEIVSIIERYLGAGAWGGDMKKVPDSVDAKTDGNTAGSENKDTGGQNNRGLLNRSIGIHSSDADLAVFDFHAAVKTFLGNEETVRRLLQPQMDQIKKETQNIRRAMAEQDWEGVRMSAHNIKGSCLNMSMNRCGQTGAELEAAGLAGNASDAKKGLSRLEREFLLLQTRVDRVLED